MKDQQNNPKLVEGRKQTFINRARTKKEEELSPSEQEELTNIISEYLKLIFTSQKLSNIQTINLDYLFGSMCGRSYFCNSLYQPKFKENKGHCLEKESFDDLFKLIFGALLKLSNLDENYTNLEQSRLITKCLFHYYKY